MAFNQSITSVEHYAVFVVSVTGMGHEADGKAVKTRREFRVTALITDTEQPLILGLEVIDQQNIVFLPKHRKAVFFYGEPHEMIVDMVSWNDVKEKFNNTGTKQNAIHISETERELVKEKMNDYFKTKTRRDDTKFIGHDCNFNHEYDDIDKLIADVSEKPKEVISKFKRPYLRWMIFAMIILGLLFQNSSLNYYTSSLRNTVYSYKNMKWLSHKEVAKKMNIKSVRDNISMSKKLITYEIETLEPQITINNMKKINLIGEELIDENKKELIEAEKAIDEILKTLCKENKEELRPPEFPQKYWKYVFDMQKDKVEERFASLRNKRAYDTEMMIDNQVEGEPPLDKTKLPKNRLEEIMKKLMLIDISTETPARAMKKDLFMAQCLANIDRYEQRCMTQ